MNREELLKMNSQLNETWNMRQPEKLFELFDENFVLTINGGKETYRNRNEVKEYFSHWYKAFPDMQMNIRRKIIGEDSFAAEYGFSGTQKESLKLSKNLPEIEPTNKKVNFKGSYFATIKNGKISELNLYPNYLGLAEELDVVSDLLQHA